MIPIRVAIVEDHALVRAGLRTSMESAGMRVVAEAPDGVDGLDAIASAKPDVAIVDLGLPGKDGIALTREVKALRRCTEGGHPHHARARRRSARRPLCRRRRLLRQIVRSRSWLSTRSASSPPAATIFDPRIAHVVLRRLGGAPGCPGSSPLTPRETEILKLVADGIGNNDIALALHIGLGTVKGHIADILEKLSASDRAQAAVTAYRRGLIP